MQPKAARAEWLPAREVIGLQAHSVSQRPARAGRVDSNVLGTRLRTGGATFLQGLGMPSTSRVAYDVSGYRKFEAEMAIDDAAGRNGSVIFKVLLETRHERVDRRPTKALSSAAAMRPCRFLLT